MSYSEQFVKYQIDTERLPQFVIDIISEIMIANVVKMNDTALVRAVDLARLPAEEQSSMSVLSFEANGADRSCISNIC